MVTLFVVTITFRLAYSSTFLRHFGQIPNPSLSFYPVVILKVFFLLLLFVVDISLQVSVLAIQLRKGELVACAFIDYAISP